MRHYEPSTPRAAAGLTAAAMAAITIGTLVVLPAQFESARVDPYEVDAQQDRRGVVEIAIGPARSEETAAAERDDAVRTERTAFAKGSAGKRQQWNSHSRTHT